VKKLAFTAVAAGAGLISSALMPMAAQARPEATPRTSLNWSACTDESLAGLECASLQVPLDHSKPNGQQITLALSRVKHTGATGFQGSILVNPGGPGGTGRDFALRVANGMSDSLKATYDVVGFDPRFIGGSTPAMSCQSNYFDAVRPDYLPTSPVNEATWLARSAKYAAECGAKYPELLQHMKTTDSAQDMDSIRAALGENQINYYGASYGTYLGSVYATMFPSHVRRMVLDSNVAPSDAWYQANLEQNKAFEGNIQALFAWIAKYDSVYHVGTTEQAVSDFYYSTRASLVKSPAGGIVGGDELDDTFLVAGYIDQGPYWPFLANTLAQAKAGNSDALVSAYQTLGITSGDNGYVGYVGVECSDVQWPKSWAKWKADNTAEYNEGYRFNTWSNAWFNAPCLFWPAKSGTPVDVGNATGVPPILLFQATNDGATPFPGGLEMNKRLQGSRLVIEDGGRTHGVVERGNACIDDKFTAFMTDGTLPANMTHCDRLPEPVPPASSSARTLVAPKFPDVLTK
jgi:pimeloyl-ACP methyl ester carboxylesterase